ncbi:L-threonylcarbamoyladenylate synthase [Coleofasciculus sp. FACHB-1120]|uniref:L-threonylcarbamoyladenylate synthase n=1 Tax=Coleofasciculus sp. FACHB-1120 TaxID=2692783 RepID=UPI0016831A32|nr:L-threonylcarbamoyladenylate synthase [Coleofasciculus sp. FACHB-1120]MBD2741840.1 threonylcarbamoyl-AMP synthase [Coleofasciculus sp. FACHB-1120]
MATIYNIHPDTPQTRGIEQIVGALRDGAVMLYPTDTVYAIGCDLNVKSAVERVRQIKQLSNDKPLTFLCPSLSNIAQYAVVTDVAYRIMRNLIPGTYTFLLPATKLVPKLVMSPKRKTTGIRVPEHTVCQSLLQALGNPIISTSAHLEDRNGNAPTLGLEKAKLFDQVDKLVDLIVDIGSEPGDGVSTILDLTGEEPVIVRRGLGWEAATAWATSVS